MTPIYGHYCPVAHSLELVGDRWSLLIVRDLLRKPQRFTSLLNSLNNITPKWLTLRLRKLEQAGIIERDKQEGQREVWYRLTQAGQDLRPVVEALTTWGLRYAMSPPRPGEVVHPEMAMATLTASLNKRDRKMLQPVTWLFNFTPEGSSHILSFNGACWSTGEGKVENPDVSITTSPETWATFLAINRDERRKYAQAMQLTGTPEHINEFLHTFGVRDEIPQTATSP